MSSTSSSTRTPSFSLSLHALLTFPIRICNPPPAASSVRSCKITPLIKVSLDDVLNKRHLPPLTLKDFEEWLVFVEGKPQYLYFLLWLKEYESRYANWLTEYGFSYYPTTPLSSSSSSDPPPVFKKTTSGDDGHLINNTLNHLNQALAIPTTANINYIPLSPPLALFFTRAKKTFLDPTASLPSPYTLPYSALSTLIPVQSSTHSLSASIPHFNPASRPDLVDINERWKHASKTLFGPESHPHPHPKEFAALANHIRGVLKDSLERFAVSACHNVGTRRAWCGLAGGAFLVLLFGVMPTLFALFYGHSRWIRLIGFLGCWVGGTVIFSSLHGICMMIYLFGDLRQLRSFELVKPAISNPRAIARARPRLKSLFTQPGEEESPSAKIREKERNNPAVSPSKQRQPGAEGPQKTDQKFGGNRLRPQPSTVPQPSHPLGNVSLSSPPLSPALVLPGKSGLDAPVVKLGFSVTGGNKGEEIGRTIDANMDADMGMKRGTTVPGQNYQTAKGNNNRLPLQLSTILSTSVDALSPIVENADASGASSPASSVDDFNAKKQVVGVVVPDVIPNDSTGFQSSNYMDSEDIDDSSSGSSSDHGIVVSPAFQTSVRYGHQDEWMWESAGRTRSEPRDKEEKRDQKETWRTSKNSSPRSRVMSAVGSVIQWASSRGRVNSTTTSSCNNNNDNNKHEISGGPPQDSTDVKEQKADEDEDEKAQISAFISSFTTSSVSCPTAAVDQMTSIPRPTSHAGTFGVRSWIGNNTRRSSMSENPHHYTPGNRRTSTRASSRWSRGFGFGFRTGVHSVPEEGVFEGPSEYVSTQCATCPDPGYESGLDSSHTRSVSQAQTIESFYAPPRASIFGTGALAHSGVGLDSGSDQCTASFIPREYSAEVLPDLESVPRVSLSMSRSSISGDRPKDQEKEMRMRDGPCSPTVAVAPSRPRVPPRAPLFSFEGLPGLVLEDDEFIGDDEENKENVPIPVEPSTPAASRSLPHTVRPRPPRLQLHNSTAASPSSASPLAVPPISPALPSSQFAHSVTGYHYHHSANNFNNTIQSSLSSPSPYSTSSPLSPLLPHPLPLKTKDSRFWFDTCPRHPAVEAKIAEACALEEQMQQPLSLRKKRSTASSTLLAPPHPPHSPASSSAPTFYSSSVAGVLPKDSSYAYPYAAASPRHKTWTARWKDTFHTLMGRSTAQTRTTSAHTTPELLSSNFFSSSSDDDSNDSTSGNQWRSRLKSVTSVPAFGPLTRVFEPLISRGQWEIVVRSAVYAFLSVWIWLGVLISLPVMHMS